MLQHAFVSLERSGNTYSLTVYDVNTSNPDRFVRKTFTYTSEVEASQGELNVIGDAVYIAPHNKVLYLRDGLWYLEDFVSTFPSIVGIFPGVNEFVETSTIGRLTPEEKYYYTARYRYQDGHVTQVGYPVFLPTNERVFNIIDIPLVQDGDRFADVELFRKEGAGEFQLLERLRDPQPTQGSTLRYTDYGKLTSTALVNRVSVWNKSHQTQAVVRDRYVRSNVTFPDLTPEVVATASFSPKEIEIEREGLPYNSRVQIYTKVRFEDAQESYFQQKADFPVNADGELRATLTSSNGKETAFYAKYANQADVETISFSSQEIYNLNVPSLATIVKPEAEQDRPVNPHVFLGYRYLLVLGTWLPAVFDEDFFEGAGGNLRVLSPIDNGEIFDPNEPAPTRIYVQAGHIQPRYSTTPRRGYLPYVVTAWTGFDYDTETRFVYQLEYVDALQESITQGKLFVKSEENTGTINPFNKEQTQEQTESRIAQYSNTFPNIRFFNVNIQIVGLEDKSLLGKFSGDVTSIAPPLTSRIYLLLDPESIYSNFDFSETVLFENRISFPFSLLNVEYIEYDDEIIDSGFFFDRPNNQQQGATKRFYNTGLRYSKNVNPDLPLIYLGKITDPGTINLRSGYVKRRDNGFEYFELPEYNIYETLVTEGDFGQIKTIFPNQVIWSDTFVEGTNVSGIRNFRPESFLNISTENGPIIKLEYVRNNLLVFCTNGVAVVTVGEVLTQGTEAQVRVDSSRFLNSEIWILKDSPTIDKRSIKRIEDMIFFADTNDVWMYSEGIQNISNGAVPVNGGVGLIDPVNKEYQITTGGRTWAFNYEVNEWVGPFTFANGVNTFYNDRVISAVDGRISDHNFGNDFSGRPYETIVESVAEDLQDSSTDKLYRKFYVQHDGDARFEYSKGQEYHGRQLSEYRQTGDTKQIGVKSIGAAKKMFWRFKTFKEFVLKLIAFEYTPRNRR